MTEHTLLIILSVVIALLCFFCAFLFYRLQQLTRGKNAASLEQSIISILQYHETYKRDHEKVVSRLASLEDRMRKTIRKISTVRFDPFEGSGSGKQSFAIALLDDDGNGAVVSSLHARDNVRVFAKTISEFSSPHELSEEELRAISNARG